jgi:hypothetical protein
MVSLSAGWRFRRHLVARATGERGFSNLSEGRDILTAGVSWRFGR